MEGTERIQMKIAILILFLSVGIFAAHYSFWKSNGFQSFWPIGGFQQHVSHAHFEVELYFDVLDERVRALQKTLSSLGE